MDEHGAAHGGREVFIHLNDNPHYKRDCAVIQRLLHEGAVVFERDTGTCFIYRIVTSV